ncbi:hypothetical protein LIER_42845 [Lithospermum erythrorhizon]|uniref:RNase H type-1 domain-containing protein n=1 Tax=Lithospermum erythrorhizon TaxID=34254 RepID=A0AAV3P0K3_LITER
MGPLKEIQVLRHYRRIWDLRDGLELAFKHLFNSITIETDSLVVANIFHNVLHDDDHYNTPVLDCRWLLARLGDSPMNHVFREGNKPADTMANLGCSLTQDFCVFITPAVEVLHLIELDCDGIGSIRHYKT